MDPEDTPEHYIYKSLLKQIMNEKKKQSSSYSTNSVYSWDEHFWEDERYNKYNLNDMRLAQVAMDARVIREKEEKRLANLPHYVQYYGDENTDGSVSTHWVRMSGLPSNIIYNYAIRTIIRQDKETFAYVKRKDGKELKKPVNLTEDEEKTMVFIMLKAGENRD